MRIATWLLLGLLAPVLAGTGAQAIDLQLRGADMERALGLARWPHTDADRARFHDRYIVAVNGATVEYFAVEKVEVITEFRRVELLAEEHARLNDLFGRGGTRDVEEALGPWRGLVSIVAHLRFDVSKYITGVPPIDMVLDGSRVIVPTKVVRSGIYSGSGDQASLIGGLVEAAFDARSVGQAVRSVVMHWNEREIARVPIDFGKLE